MLKIPLLLVILRQELQRVHGLLPPSPAFVLISPLQILSVVLCRFLVVPKLLAQLGKLRQSNAVTILQRQWHATGEETNKQTERAR